MKKRLIPILSTAVVATALAITAVSTMSSVKRFAQADFNYSITFTKDTGTSVLLQDKGGTYVASGNSEVTFGGDYFCTLAFNGELLFDFDAASKAAGVDKFLSIIGVRVVADSEYFLVYGSNYQNHFGNDGEQFLATLNEGVFTFPYSMNYLFIANCSLDDIHITSVSIYYECGTQSKPDNVTSLEAPTNLAYDEDTNILSWTGVENAMTYVFQIDDVDPSVLAESASVADTEVSLDGFNIHPGNYTMSIYAKHNNIVSATTTINTTIHYVDRDLVLEAEYACLDRERLWSNDQQASGGAYAKDINDNGQGLYFRYYAYEAGQRDVTITYATGSVGSYHMLYANGQSYKVTYSEYTNWFGDAHVTADVTIEDVVFVQGWNELYLMRNGTSSDNPAWGGWAQIDYITIEGTGNKYDVSLFDKTSNVYNLEAEMGHWHWADGNQRPDNWSGEGTFSFGYGLGQINAGGDGVKFDIDIAEAGTYAIRPVLGGNRNIYISIDGGTYTRYDFGAYKEWNDPTIAANDVCQVELTAGFHYIDFTRGDNWCTMDKFVFEKVA